MLKGQKSPIWKFDDWVLAKEKKNINALKKCALGQNPTFYPEITNNLMFENVNFVKNEVSKMRIL